MKQTKRNKILFHKKSKKEQNNKTLNLKNKHPKKKSNVFLRK